MYKEKDAHTASFYTVAMLTIMIGSAFVAVGAVSWVVEAVGQFSTLVDPASTIASGMIILSLGYIHLELELLRRKQ